MGFKELVEKCQDVEEDLREKGRSLLSDRTAKSNQISKGPEGCLFQTLSGDYYWSSSSSNEVLAVS